MALVTELGPGRKCRTALTVTIVGGITAALKFSPFLGHKPFLMLIEPLGIEHTDTPQMGLDDIADLSHK
jgi:hypothetical protein